jgi:hypothetical protein
MEIIKFNNFINENVQINVLDVVIDKDGNVYNGISNPLVKGNVIIKPVKLPGEEKSNKNVGIIGNDKNNYIAGIDKNGNLVAPYDNISSDGYLMVDGEYIEIPDSTLSILKIKNNKWKFGTDYSKLLSPDSTGWVNFKVDMEIFKRVKRYSSGIGSYKRGHKSFISKLQDLHSINFIKHRRRNIKSVQKEMSIIMLLHYIEEIKSFFTPSAAGFLFESFIGGLLPNAKIVSDNGVADIVSDGKEYQVKTLEAHNSPSVELIMKQTETGLKYLDYYVICFKHPGRIEIYVLEGDRNSDTYCGDITDDRGVKVDDKSPKLTKNKITKPCTYVGITKSPIRPYIIDLLDIDNNIDRISKGLKGTLNNLFEELSKFQYNVETIIAGVNRDGKIIDGDEFVVYSNDARGNANEMRKELDNLIAHYKREPKI